MKSRIIVTCFHVLHLSFTTYISKSFHTPSSALFPIYWLTVLLALFLFYYTSFSDPGRLSTQKPVPTTKPEVTYHHQQSSLGSILTSSSNLNLFKTGTQGVRPGDLPQDFALNPISESLDNHDSHFDSVSINLDIIQDDENPSLIQAQTEKNEQKINSKAEPAESVQASVNCENEAKDKKKVKFDYSYCTVCFIDQPLRAKHCKDCGACVAMFDHHCPFVDNCIGEKNKVWFFWMVFALAVECWITFAELIGGIEKNEKFSVFWEKNWMNLTGSFFPFFIGILLGFLWVYHCCLALFGLTTFEVIKGKNLHYLENGKKNPFNKGALKNLAYFCRPCKEVTIWTI